MVVEGVVAGRFSFRRIIFLFVIATATVIVLSNSSQDVYAIPYTIADQTSCEALPGPDFPPTWDSSTNTCTISSFTNLKSVNSLTVKPGVTLVITDTFTAYVPVINEAGGTININLNGGLDIYNSALANYGTINVNVGSFTASGGIINNYPGGIINNSPNGFISAANTALIGAINNCGGTFNNLGRLFATIGNDCRDPTATTVTPNPASVVSSKTITFEAEVQDILNSPTTPTGDVKWDDGGAGGAFSPSSCPLLMQTSSMSNCIVTYTAPVIISNFDINANYPGDTTHQISLGSSHLTVTAPPPGGTGGGGTGGGGTGGGGTGTASSACGCTKTGPFVSPTVVQANPDGTSPDGKSKVTIDPAGPTLTLTRISDGRIIIDHATSPAGWGFSPDGKYFVLASNLNSGSHQFDLATYDIANARVAINFGTITFGTGVAPWNSEDDGQNGGSSEPGSSVSNAGWGFGPDGKIFALAISSPTSPTNYSLFVYNLESKSVISNLEFSAEDATSAFWQFSPCGNIFQYVTLHGPPGGQTQSISFWSLPSGAVIQQSLDRTTIQNALASTQTVASGSGFDILLDGTKIGSINGCTVTITAFSPVNIIVNSAGLKTGFDPSTGGAVNQILGSSYTGVGSEPQTIMLPYSVGGYSVQAFGLSSLTSPQDFHITFATFDGNGQIISSTTKAGTATVGSLQSYDFSLDSQGTVTLVNAGGGPPIPEFPFSFSLVIIFVAAAAVYMVIRQKMTTNFKRF